MTGTPESREHVSEMCARFDEVLDNVGTVLQPWRHNDEAVARASAEMDRLYAESRTTRAEQDPA